MFTYLFRATRGAYCPTMQPFVRMLRPCALATLLTVRTAGAAIFEFTDAHGTVHYSNVPIDKRYHAVIDLTQDEAAREPPVDLLLQKSAVFSSIIEVAARTNQLEPALVRAVMLAESGCDPHAASKRGARGLMQLMPATARQYGVSDVFDPEQNIRAGSRYLRDLTDRYQNDLELVLAAYNAGPGTVDQNGRKIPPLKETLDYVPRVLQIYRHLLELARAR